MAKIKYSRDGKTLRKAEGVEGHFEIPASVTTIGYGAFDGCTGLTSIVIPEGVKKIGESSFSGCSSLTSITLPGSVTEIEEYAFKDCTGLTSVLTAPALRQS